MINRYDYNNVYNYYNNVVTLRRMLGDITTMILIYKNLGDITTVTPIHVWQQGLQDLSQ